MGHYKKLANNTLLFFIANFGSKLISFFMVPFYTHVLTTAEYGTVDIITSTVALLTPLITMGIGDVVVMVLIRKEQKKEVVFSNVFLIILLGNIGISILYPILYGIDFWREYAVLFALLMIFQSLYGILQAIARGIGDVVSFAVSGIMYTFVLVILNIVCLTVLDLGIVGYLSSIAAAYIFCCLFLIIRTKFFSQIKISYVNKAFCTDLLKLGIPILPTAILWTLMNIADKYTILYYYGSEANGLYTVAHKVPTIIATIYSVFQSAWQLTAFEVSEKKERSKTYSELFDVLTCFLLGGACILFLFCEPFVVVFCEKSYYDSWYVMPVLIMSSVYSSFSGFLGSNYIPMRNTVAALKVTVVGTVLNVMLNLILVPLCGIQGAAIATCVSFVYMTFKKIYDFREFTPLNVDWRRFGLLNILALIQIVCFFAFNRTVAYCCNIFLIMIEIYLYKSVLRKILLKIRQIVTRKLKNKANAD